MPFSNVSINFYPFRKNIILLQSRKRWVIRHELICMFRAHLAEVASLRNCFKSFLIVAHWGVPKPFSYCSIIIIIMSIITFRIHIDIKGTVHANYGCVRCVIIFENENNNNFISCRWCWHMFLCKYFLFSSAATTQTQLLKNAWNEFLAIPFK